jgi:hypothetical protein
MLATLAIVSALSAYVEYIRTSDVRWLIGGTMIIASWPYAYFVMIPVNGLLYGHSQERSGFDDPPADPRLTKRRSVSALLACSHGLSCGLPERGRRRDHRASRSICALNRMM